MNKRHLLNKKLLPVIAIAVFATLNSCKKDYVCHCKYLYNNTPNNAQQPYPTLTAPPIHDYYISLSGTTSSGIQDQCTAYKGGLPAAPDSSYIYCQVEPQQ